MDADGLGEWFDQRGDAHDFSGVALVWRDAAPLLQYAGGIAHRGHGVLISNETRFGVASVTKMVTATTALRLVERGELRLDQPLIEILPSEHRTTAMTTEHTLHHLLSHTSGLPNYHADAAQTWDSFVGALDRIPGSKARRPADMLPLFADLPAERPRDASPVGAPLPDSHRAARSCPRLAAMSGAPSYEQGAIADGRLRMHNVW